MKRFFLLSILLILALPLCAFPCSSPTDDFAVEVMLNAPWISYNLEPIKLADNVCFENGTFAYLSHFDDRVAVILEDIDESGMAELLDGLSVRIQIPTMTAMVDGMEDLVEAADIRRDNFDFKAALKTELEWLSTSKIISGISGENLVDIEAVSEAGLAGWNSRIVCESGRWLSYNETTNPNLIRGIDCGGFDPDRLVYDETIILPEASNASPNGNLITQWGMIK